MQFITIQNHIGETIAINPKLITSISCGINNVVIVFLNEQAIHTNFPSIRSAVDYVESTWWGRENDGKSIKWDSDP